MIVRQPVTRYSPFLEYPLYDEDDVCVNMEEDPSGDYVDITDYIAVKDQLDALLEWKAGFLNELTRS